MTALIAVLTAPTRVMDLLALGILAGAAWWAWRRWAVGA